MSNARILLVEGEAIIALDLQTTLKEIGHEVVGAAAAARIRETLDVPIISDLVYAALDPYARLHPSIRLLIPSMNGSSASTQTINAWCG